MKSFISTMALVAGLASYAHGEDLKDYVKSCSSADRTQSITLDYPLELGLYKVTALGMTYKFDEVTIVETETQVLQDATEQIPQRVYSAYQRISRKDGGPLLANDVYSTGDYVVCRLVKKSW